MARHVPSASVSASPQKRAGVVRSILSGGGRFFRERTLSESGYDDISQLRRKDRELYEAMLAAADERKRHKDDFRYLNRPRGALARWLEIMGVRNPSLSERGITVGDTP